MITYLKIKSGLDRLLAVLLLLILIIIPIIPLTMLAIYIEDPGNIFFFQDRVGKDGEIFKVIKFRSMYKDAEQRMKRRMEDGITDKLNFKADSASMITKVGKIIRKLSIDELPQLLNIIRGNMSIVGPRPLQLFEVVAYVGSKNSEKKNNQMAKRESVKPGLLCFWQVAPQKDEIPFEDRIQMDVKYVDELSLKTDSYLYQSSIKNSISPLSIDDGF